MFDIGMPVSVPKTRTLLLQNEPGSYPLVSYSLQTTFLPAVGLRLAMGYELKLITNNWATIRLPIVLSYKRLVERMEQTGSYFTGHVNHHSFRGLRKVNLAMDVFALTLGLNYTLQNNKAYAWGFDLLLSENINFGTRIRNDEMIDPGCTTCRGLGNIFLQEFQLFHSAELRVFRTFLIKDNVLSPFLGYTFNYFYDPAKNSYAYLPGTFDNPAYNLKFYHFIEAGLKIKL